MIRSLSQLLRNAGSTAVPGQRLLPLALITWSGLVLSAIAAWLGLSVCLAWLVDLGPLVAVIPANDAPMHLHSALGFFLTGTGLIGLLLHNRWIPISCGMALVVLSGISLMNAANITELALDRWLNDIGLFTSVGLIAGPEQKNGWLFVFIGAVFLLESSPLNLRREVGWLALLGVVVLGTGLLTAAGAVSADSVSAQANPLGMTLISGIGFVVVGLAAFCVAVSRLREDGGDPADATLALVSTLFLAMLYFDWVALTQFKRAELARVAEAHATSAGDVLSRALNYFEASHRVTGKVPVNNAALRQYLALRPAVESLWVSTEGGPWRIIVNSRQGIQQDSLVQMLVDERIDIDQPRLSTEKRLLYPIEGEDGARIVLMVNLITIIDRWLPSYPDELLELNFSARCKDSITASSSRNVVAQRVVLPGSLCLVVSGDPAKVAGNSRLTWGILLMSGLLGLSVLLLTRANFRQARLHEQLASTSDELSSLVSSVVEGVVRVERDMTISFANPAVAKMVNMSAQRLIGEPIWKFIVELDGSADDIPEQMENLMRSSQANGTRKRARLVSVGGSIPAELVVAPQRKGNTVPVYVVTILDLSLRERADAILKEKNRKLEKLVAELDEFSYMASHDLREPLRTIKSFTALLENNLRGNQDEKIQQDVFFIRDAAERMTQLIDGLLALSRAGSRPLRLVAEDVNTMLEDIKVDLYQLTQETGATIEIGRIPSTMRVDRVLFTQVLKNLIQNAIKYRKPDVPAVVRIYGSRDGAITRLNIEDNGIGIAPQHHGEIFGAFKRLHGTGQYEGSGIGLAIVSKIIERHNGEISLRSAPGVGTTFTIELHDDSDQPTVLGDLL